MKKNKIIGALALLSVAMVGCGSSKTANSTTDQTTQVETTATTKSNDSSTQPPTLLPKATETATLSRDRMTYTEDITYETLARYPKKNIDAPVKFTGKVIQVVGEDIKQDGSAIRLAVNDDYNQVLYVVYYNNIIDYKLLVNDEITIYAGYVGPITYTGTLGSSVTIPQVQAVMMDLHN